MQTYIHVHVCIYVYVSLAHDRVHAFMCDRLCECAYEVLCVRLSVDLLVCG